MKLSKKKVFALALAVCLIATLSFGSLAWFTDADSVTNEFMVAGSENNDPDEIFSVEVWEEGAEENEGLTYEDILPGDTHDKVAHVKNTGSYDQYIRVKITVTDAHIWQEAYKANMVPVTEFVNVDLSQVYQGKVGAYQEGDTFVYYLYYNDILPLDNAETEDIDESDMIVFTETYVCEHLDQYQAARFIEDEVAGYQISVQADAVQTEHVGGNVYEAFKTVGMEIPVNTVWVDSNTELSAAFAAEDAEYIVLDSSFDVNAKLVAHAENDYVELFLNDQMVETANGGTGYGVVVKGTLTVSGYGTLQFGNAGADLGDLIYNDNVLLRNHYNEVLVGGVAADLPARQ